MENIFFYIQNIVLYIFCLSLLIGNLNYILCSFCFILPMKKKYKILTNDLCNNDYFPSRYDLCIVSAIFIVFMLSLLYVINIWLFILTLFVFFSVYLISHNKYKNYTILNYIDYYSADLFDWHKIYDLYIDENIKRQCFYIHNIDYDNFKDRHLSYLKAQKDLLEHDIQRTIKNR